MVEFITEQQKNLMKKVFGEEKVVIGMLHTLPLPGSAMYEDNMDEIVKQGVKEAKIYADSNVDSIMIENMHDTPYLVGKVYDETVDAMIEVCEAVKCVFKKPIGIQILDSANFQALDVAKKVGLDFVRVGAAFVFGAIANSGYINACAGELLRYRKKINAKNVKVFADIKKKHASHSITADVDIAETAMNAELARADGVIVTGKFTGLEANLNDVKIVKKTVSIPVLIGSGITLENINKYLKYADGFIMGSYFKDEGKWHNPVSSNRVTQFVKKFDRLRKNLL